jgi:hypothetical protein
MNKEQNAKLIHDLMKSIGAQEHQFGSYDPVIRNGLDFLLLVQGTELRMSVNNGGGSSRVSFFRSLLK